MGVPDLHLRMLPGRDPRGRHARDACRTIGLMTTPTRPVLMFYGRASCTPCTEARHSLQWILEDRAAHGELTPVVRDLDVSSDPELEQRYGALVPVVAIGAAELPLVTSVRQLRAFLDATLPRLA